MDTYIALDLETTGLSAQTNEIIEIGAWKIEDGVVKEKFNTFVKPMGYLNSEITRITGITQEMVADACTIDEILPAFYEWCKGYPFLGHNLPFDYSFLLDKGNRMMLDFSEQGTRTGIDTLELSRKVLKKLEHHNLQAVADYFNIKIQNTEESYHRAWYDAYMSKLIYDRFLYLYPNVAGVQIPERLEREDKRVYGKVQNDSTLSFT